MELEGLGRWAVGCCCDLHWIGVTGLGVLKLQKIAYKWALFDSLLSIRIMGIVPVACTTPLLRV